MKKIFVIPSHEWFMEVFIERFFDCLECDLSRTAVVFPGHRPFLYLNRALGKKFGRPFFPVKEFTMADFLEKLAVKTDQVKVRRIDPLDGAAMIVEIISAVGGPLGKKADAGVSELFPWAEKLYHFIDLLDRENVPDDKIRNLADNAKIGFEDVPEDLNELFKDIISIRKEFHERLQEKGFFTGGTLYLEALKNREDLSVVTSQYDTILFAGLFALTGVEREIVRSLWREGKAEIIWNADPADFPKVLKPLLSFFNPKEGIEVLGTKKKPDNTVLSLHAAFDAHSEALTVRDILTHNKIEDTAVICPLPDTLFPVLTFAVEDLKKSGHLDNFNISLRYPLGRTSFFGLIKTLMATQKSSRQKDGVVQYKAKDYLRVIFHPFVKNIEMGEDSVRDHAYVVAKALRGDLRESSLRRTAYISLSEAENDSVVNEWIRKGLKEDSPERLLFIKKVHQIFFKAFSDISSLETLCDAVTDAMQFIIDHSKVKAYILAGEVIKALFDIVEKIRRTDASKIELGRNLIFSIFMDRMSDATIAFSTRPLQNLELLGMLETRNLNFKNVIILDVQEGVLPSEKKTDPLIPLAAYELLGLPDTERSQEMEFYYFKRLVSAAENVHLVWVEDAERQRSRFIEQIVWEKEKRDGQIGGMPVSRISLPVKLIIPQSTSHRIRKDESVMLKLKNHVFSPTWIDSYLNCRLRFYYEKILGLTPPGEVAEGMEADEQGIIIHDILRRTLEPFKGMVLSAEKITEVRQSLSSSIEKCLGVKNKSGEYYLFRRLVDIRLNDYINRIFFRQKMFTILDLERELSGIFNTGKNQIKLKGTIDRLDDVCGIKTIIDYKTGMVKPKDRIDINADLGEIEVVRKLIHSFQLSIYVCLLMQSEMGVTVESADARLVYLQDEEEVSIFKLDKKNRPGSPAMILNDFYLKALGTVADELLDPQLDFQPYTQQDCENCPFSSICGAQ